VCGEAGTHSTTPTYTSGKDSRARVQYAETRRKVRPKSKNLQVCVLLLQDLLQSCSRGGGRRVEDMCYERLRAEACVDESAHHALVNAGGREIV
jgi:hypothetical protein